MAKPIVRPMLLTEDDRQMLFDGLVLFEVEIADALTTIAGKDGRNPNALVADQFRSALKSSEAMRARLKG